VRSGHPPNPKTGIVLLVTSLWKPPIVTRRRKPSMVTPL
jgi:hypothetical protein